MKKKKHVWSKNDPIFGVILTPDLEQKELFVRSKIDPKSGVNLRVKVTPKKGLFCTYNFYSIFGVIITPKYYCAPSTSDCIFLHCILEIKLN